MGCAFWKQKNNPICDQKNDAATTPLVVKQCSTEHCYCKGYKNNELATKFNLQLQLQNIHLKSIETQTTNPAAQTRATLKNTNNDESVTNIYFISRDINGIIITYLDQCSLIQCYYVCKEWFCNTHRRTSLGHFSLTRKNLCYLQRNTCEQGFNNTICSYHKIRSLELEVTISCIRNKLQSLTTCLNHFINVRNLSIIVSRLLLIQKYCDPASKLIQFVISRNSNHLEALILDIGSSNNHYGSSCNFVIDCKNITFRNLKSIWIESNLVQMPIQNITKKNCNKIKHLILKKDINFNTLNHLNMLPLSQIEILEISCDLNFFRYFAKFPQKIREFSSQLKQIKILKLNVMNNSHGHMPFHSLFLSNLGSSNTVQRIQLNYNQANLPAIKHTHDITDSNCSKAKKFENATHLKFTRGLVWRSDDPTVKDAIVLENIIDKFIVYNMQNNESSLDTNDSCNFNRDLKCCMLLELELVSIYYETGMLAHLFNYLSKIMFKKLQILTFNGNDQQCIVCNYSNLTSTLILINNFLSRVLGLNHTYKHKYSHLINRATMPSIRKIVMKIAVRFKHREKNQSKKINKIYNLAADNLDVCFCSDDKVPKMVFIFHFFVNCTSIAKPIQICM